MKIFFVLLAALSLPYNLNACIWQSTNKSGASPFWPSNNIEVCFAPPKPQPMGDVLNPLDYEYRTHYSNNIALMRRTLENQINTRTAFNLTGFGYCNDQEDPNRSSKIRIDLNDTEGNGALASSIGPQSMNQSTNLMISSLDQDWPGGVKPNFNDGSPIPRRVRTFNSSRHMSWVILHETLHLLGFHHTEYWDQNMENADIDLEKVIQFGIGEDTQSVMNRGTANYDSSGMALLSERDVACLNHVANKTILNYPDRPASSGVPRIEAPHNDSSSPIMPKAETINQ